MIVRFVLPIFCLLSAALKSRAEEFSYTIVVSEITYSDTEWSKVVDRLRVKYPQSAIITWKENVGEILKNLADQHPRYTCFVAKSTEVSRDFVASVHRVTRQLDKDPYCDTLWGILTGYDAKNAIEIASEEDPLTIDQVSAGTEIALSMCNQGVWYDELVQHKKVEKLSDGTIAESKGPADTTHALANSLCQESTQLFVTSGHATERNWQIGFRYRNGYFQSKAGQMYGRTTTGEVFPIESKTPKVYMAVGNCLMGHIDGPDAMALAWMNSVGVKQMVGYTVLTWYGYSGWGVLDYFVEQPGRYSMTEAFHANQHALIHRINTFFPELSDAEITAGSNALPMTQPTPEGQAIGLKSSDSRGLLWDRDTVAFYGDPAWNATLRALPKAFDQSLTIQEDVYTLTVTPRTGNQSYEPINTNGSQRGGRPILEFLPHRIGDVTIVKGQELNPVITDDFVLIQNQVAKQFQKPIILIFRARPIATPKRFNSLN